MIWDVADGDAGDFPGHAGVGIGGEKEFVVVSAVQGVVDLSAPVTQSGSVAAALTIPYVKTSRSLSDDETVGLVVLAAQEISNELGGDKRPIS